MLAITPADWANIARDRRIRLGLSQAEVAKTIGKSRQWMVGFEGSRSGVVSLDLALRLIDALGLDVELTDPDGDA